MSTNKKTIMIAIPVLFILLFSTASMIALFKGGDTVISIGFLFGFLTMPTSIFLNQIVDNMMNHNVPMTLQYLLIGLSGLINIGIIEGLYLLLTREKKIDI